MGTTILDRPPVATREAPLPPVLEENIYQEQGRESRGLGYLARKLLLPVVGTLIGFATIYTVGTTVLAGSRNANDIPQNNNPIVRPVEGGAPQNPAVAPLTNPDNIMPQVPFLTSTDPTVTPTPTQANNGIVGQESTPVAPSPTVAVIISTPTADHANTPVPTATPQPSPAPSSTPTSIPIFTPTNTPEPTPSPAPTRMPTVMPTPEIYSDLTIKSLDYEVRRRSDGSIEGLYYSIRIANSGDRDSRQINLRVRINGNVYQIPVDGIKANGEYVIEDVLPVSAGDVEIVADVDAENEVKESNENNNTVAKKITVDDARTYLVGKFSNDSKIGRYFSELNNVSNATLDELQELAQYLDSDYDHVYRALFAADYLNRNQVASVRDFSVAVEPNTADRLIPRIPYTTKFGVREVNSMLRIYSRHKETEGVYDTSGMVSTSDWIKALFLWGYPGDAIKDGTRIAIRDLINMYPKTFVAQSDVSYKVIGSVPEDRKNKSAWPEWYASLHPEDNHIPNTQIVNVGPLSTTEPVDPRFYVRDENGNLISVIESLRKCSEGDCGDYSKFYDLFRRWVTNIEYSLTPIHNDLISLSLGDPTSLRHNFTRSESEFEANELVTTLTRHGDIVENLPMNLRPYSRVTYRNGSDMLWQSGIRDDDISTSWDGTAFRAHARVGNMPKRENIIIYIPGMEFRVNVHPEGTQLSGTTPYGQANHEYVGIIKTDGEFSFSQKYGSDGYSQQFKDNNTLAVMGEPYPEIDGNLNVDTNRTRESWKTSGYVTQELRFQVYGKVFELKLGEIDEGNYVEKVFDNSADMPQNLPQ